MKSTNFIRQWASYLTEGLKSYDEIIEDTKTTQVDQHTTQKPNIIFCDIDGIIVDIASKDSDFENAQLNQDQYHIDPSAVEVLKDVCSKTNSKIVIDSAWTWIKNGEKTKMIGTTHKLRSRIPEIKKALGEFLFESEPLTPILTKEEIPGNENVNFDETGFPISANRKLKDGTVKTIPFNLSIMKPFCIAKWLDSHKNEIEKYVIIDNNTKSLKWGASKTNYNSEMTSALMDMNTSALVSTKGNAILDYFGVEKNDIEDTVDMEVSETDEFNDVNETGQANINNPIEFSEKEKQELAKMMEYCHKKYKEYKTNENMFEKFEFEGQALGNVWDMVGHVAESLLRGYKTSFLLGYIDAIGTCLNSVDEHKLPKPTDPRDIA